MSKAEPAEAAGGQQPMAAHTARKQGRMPTTRPRQAQAPSRPPALQLPAAQRLLVGRHQLDHPLAAAARQLQLVRHVVHHERLDLRHGAGGEAAGWGRARKQGCRRTGAGSSCVQRPKIWRRRGRRPAAGGHNAGGGDSPGRTLISRCSCACSSLLGSFQKCRLRGHMGLPLPVSSRTSVALVQTWRAGARGVGGGRMRA